MGIRDVVYNISPPWLQRGQGVHAPASQRVAASLLYSLSAVIDTCLEKIDQAVHSWMPTRTKTPTSLPYIGQDRRILQGPSESNTAYGIRLQRAFDSWRFAGMPRGKLEQLLGYVSPATPRMLQVSTTTEPVSNTPAAEWYYYAAGADPDDPPTHLYAFPNNWDWDSLSDPAYAGRWWRIWPILDRTGWVTATKKWGDAGLKWGSTSFSWGFDSPRSVFSAMRLFIVKLWKGSHAHVLWIIVRTDMLNDHFIPTDAPGSASLPDGRWGRWSKVVNGVRVAARSSGARYIDGVE